MFDAPTGTAQGETLYDPRVPVESKRLMATNDGCVLFDRHPVYPGTYEVRSRACCLRWAGWCRTGGCENY